MKTCIYVYTYMFLLAKSTSASEIGKCHTSAGRRLGEDEIYLERIFHLRCCSSLGRPWRRRNCACRFCHQDACPDPIGVDCCGKDMPEHVKKTSEKSVSFSERFRRFRSVQSFRTTGKVRAVQVSLLWQF